MIYSDVFLPLKERTSDSAGLITRGWGWGWVRGGGGLIYASAVPHRGRRIRGATPSTFREEQEEAAAEEEEENED